MLILFKQEYTVTSFISGDNFLRERKNGQIMIQEQKAGTEKVLHTAFI